MCVFDACKVMLNNKTMESRNIAALATLYLLRAQFRCRRTLQHSLRIPNSHHLTLLHALERQRRDQRGADTRAVFSGHDLDRVVPAAKRLAVTAFLPVEDLLESLCAAGL